ncbi:MAG: hypothetical protein RLZZ253_2289, partial [Verrucomicrobiota bacterium]
MRRGLCARGQGNEGQDGGTLDGIQSGWIQDTRNANPFQLGVLETDHARRLGRLLGTDLRFQENSRVTLGTDLRMFRLRKQGMGLH